MLKYRYNNRCKLYSLSTRSLFSLSIIRDCLAKLRTSMEQAMPNKRSLDDEPDQTGEKQNVDKAQNKVPKLESADKYSNVRHAKNRLIPKHVFDKLTEKDIDLIENVKTSCLDLERIQAAISLRRKHRLSYRLPEDMEDSTYYIEHGLRKVYPYPYLYQTYVKRRWIGRKLKDILKEEFRDITDEQLRMRFDLTRVLVNSEPVKFDYILRDNDFVSNRNHRHELPVLATPIRKIYEDSETLVIDKPPSVPIHPCGRFRHNSVTNILAKEYKYDDLKVVHRLDRLVSGVLIIAKNSTRAHKLELMIRGREVQKEYVCRVDGDFPLGKPEDDGYITVDAPLEHLPGKVGLSVVDPTGKESTTKFKRLSYNGKTSSVLCKPLTGRMHQIRVHLQYLGHPIVNDTLYNSDVFGPEKGKGARYGKSMKQLSADVIASHRASAWLITDDNDFIDPSETKDEKPINKDDDKELDRSKNYGAKFLNDDEREETMAAIEHFFTIESWKDLEQKWQFEQEKYVEDPTCRDCSDKFHDPPLRTLYLYLHALRYSGTGWCYESDMPTWARESWKY